MKGLKSIPVLILSAIAVLVPFLRSKLFFDSYIIKLWFAELSVSLLFIYFCCGLFFRKGDIWVNPPAMFLLILYLLINTVSWIRIPYVHRYPALITFVSLFFYILLCFLVSQYIRDKSVVRIIFILWTVSALCISAGGIYQHYTGQRVIGTLGNENFLAAYIAMTIPLSAAVFTEGIRRRRMIILSAAAVYAVFLWTIYLARCRGAFLGLFCGMVCFFVFVWCRRRFRAAVIAVIILISAAVSYLPCGARFISRQFRGDVRPSIWEATLYMIAQRPLLGWGKGAYFMFYPQFRIQDYWLTKSPTDLTPHAHNEFLQIWAETGTAGLLSFLALIFILLRGALNKIDAVSPEERYIPAGIAGAIICLLAHNLVSNNLQMPSSAVMMWFLLGILAGYNGQVRKLPGYSGMFPGRILFGFVCLSILLIYYLAAAVPAVSHYFFRKGWTCRLRNEWKDAAAFYKRAVRWYPWDPEMYYRSAYAYVNLKRYEDAIKEYKKVIQLAPAYGTVYRNMGIAYMQEGRDKDAAVSFLYALRFRQNDLVAEANLSAIRHKHNADK